MTLETINSNVIKNMFIAGAKYLESKKKYVDELNVFPVPDGDTGTNMTLTILAAAKEVDKAKGSDMAAIAKAISSGSLRGARGNSGVILSQLLRGFSKEISSHDELDTIILANAMEKGVQTAYKAVMKPKEGTILTVARKMAEKAAEVAVESQDILFLLNEVFKYGNEVLEQTPDMLPVLKEAGVVDAGGQGLMYIIQGGIMALENGTDVTLELSEESPSVDEEPHVSFIHVEKDIKFGYCTEFIIDTGDRHTLEENEKHANGLKRFLGTIGDSIVSVADEDLIKIHVHTNDPGTAMQRALTIGQLSNIKVDNMRLQHEEHIIKNVDEYLRDDENIEIKPKEEKPYGFVVVSVGEGINTIFKSLGVDYVVTGGQTMNPSTEDFVKAVSEIPSKVIYILPNNKNIILAAGQVNELVEDKEIYVIPTKTIPQGVSALIAFDTTVSPEENVEVMTQMSEDVKTGQVTFAVRDTSIDSKPIQAGDILGISDDGIAVVNKDIKACTFELIDTIVDSMSELVTIYYGEEVGESEAQVIAEYIKDKYEDLEIEVHYGGQPLYYYIISVE